MLLSKFKIVPVGMFLSLVIFLCFDVVSAEENNAAPAEKPSAQLISFNVKESNGQVDILWTASSQENNHGFQVERKLINSQEWQPLEFVQGDGTTTEAKTYEYTDTSVGFGRFEYRIKIYHLNGSYTFTPSADIEITPPKTYKLEQNYPNPFNPETFIRYELSENSFVQLVIYNSLGETVRVLVNEEKPLGNYAVRWDGRNGDGEKVASGTYFYALKIYGSPVVSKQMLLVK